MKRVLKKDGVIFLVENDIGGEFEIIRNRYPNVERTKKYNNWIENKGFIICNKFETFFKFFDQNQARYVFSNIWGKDVGNKIENEKIMQKIVIYKYEKSMVET